MVVPSSISSRQILVGEFLHSADRRTTATFSKYGSESIPARSVKWLPAINEVELSPRVSETVRKPNPFVAFDRRLYSEIMDKAFGTYTYDGRFSARFDTLGPKFTGDDNLNFIILAEAVASLAQCSQLDHPRSSDSLLQLALYPKNDLHRLDLAININYPGSIQ